MPNELINPFSILMYSILSHPSSSHIIMSVRMSDSNRTICWCLASSFSFLAVSLSGIITPPLICNPFRNKSTLPVWIEPALAVVYPSESGRMIGSSAYHPPSFRNTFVNVCPINFEAHSVPLSRIPISMKSGYLSVRSIRVGSPPVSSADIAHNESFLLTPVVRFWHWHPCIIVFYVDFPFEYTAMTKICIYPYVSLVANKTHLVFFRQSFADRNPVRFCGW